MEETTVTEVLVASSYPVSGKDLITLTCKTSSVSDSGSPPDDKTGLALATM